MNIEQAKERLKSIVDFYKLNDENNYDYSDEVLISMRLVLEEIERLNNIIDELEEWLYDNTNYEEYDRVEKDTFNYVIKKIEELRNEKNEYRL